MNSSSIVTSGDGTQIALFPSPITISLLQRHPFFFWNRRHIRSVLATPELYDLGNETYFGVKYTDTRTGSGFTTKEEAEHYLGKAILQPWFENEIYQEKRRPAFAYAICRHCSRIGGQEMNIVFRGPFFLINNKIETTVHVPCPDCGWTIPIDISTERNPALPADNDCEWFLRPYELPTR